MGYNILDAIRDEISLCNDAEKLCQSMLNMGHAEVAYREQARSLFRILNRLENGVDYSIDFKNQRIANKQTGRKSDETLEKENAALRQAGENYRMVRELVSDDEKEEYVL